MPVFFFFQQQSWRRCFAFVEEFGIDCHGYKLQASLHKPVGQESQYAVIMCHGFRGSKDGGGRAVAVANAISGMGISVIRFNFTPLQGLSKQIEEIRAVVQYCRSHMGKQIILLGRSMGGSAAIAYTAAFQNIAGLCLWATPWNLEETFQLALGEGYERLKMGDSISLNDEYGIVTLTPEFVQELSTYHLLDCMGAIQPIPVFILHGDRDAIVPVCQAEALYQACGHPKEMKVFSGGDHHLSQHSLEAAQAIASWLKQNFIR